jgi:hypothetical protein
MAEDPERKRKHPQMTQINADGKSENRKLKTNLPIN